VLGGISALSLLQRVLLALHLAKPVQSALHRLVIADSKVRMEIIQENIATVVWELDLTNCAAAKRTYTDSTAVVVYEPRK
jgi:hypothetical protein